MEKNKQFFVSWFTYYMLTKLGLSFLIFYYYQIYYLVLFFSILLFITVLAIYIIHRYKNQISFEELITYTILPFVVSAVLFGNIFFEHQISAYYTAAMLLVFISVFHERKNYLKIIGMVLTTCVFSILITNFLGVSDFMHQEFRKLNSRDIAAFNYLEIFFQIIAGILISYNIFLYIQHLRNEGEENTDDLEENSGIYGEELLNDQKLNAESEKFELLYQKIIKVLEEEKPYIDSDFKITDLSKLIGSNRSYTSNALNRNGKNFNSLINFYRIGDAKTEMQKGKEVEDVYFEVGFKNFNTFLKAFSEIESVDFQTYLAQNNLSK